jgi:hypothetical protein
MGPSDRRETMLIIRGLILKFGVFALRCDLIEPR